MNWKKLFDEFGDIAITAARSGRLSLGIDFVDPVPLARAWLMGDDEEWCFRYAKPVLRAGETPSARVRRGDMPFSSGICSTNYVRSVSTIHLMPPFVSPVMARETGGIATTMPAFGGLGEQRFAGLHEIGHWLAMQARLEPANTERPGKALRSEALADGFAIAWAAAKGADPDALVRDVGLIRAANAVYDFAPAYLTFDILEPAARIGAEAARRSGAPNPWSLIDAVHGAGARHLPPADFIDELAGKSVETLATGGEEGGLGRTIARHLASQRPWSKADEREWWNSLCRSNPDDAAVFRRMPVAGILALASRSEYLDEVSGPMSAEIILGKLRTVAMLDGPERVGRLEDAMPDECSRAAFADAFEKAAGLFDGELDHVIAGSLRRFRDHASLCREEPEWRSPGPVKGMDEKPAPFVVIDNRNDGLSAGDLVAIGEKLSGAGVKAIAVVHDDRDAAERDVQMIRMNADCLSARVYAFDESGFAAKQSSIAESRRAGNVLAIGAFPEFAARTVERDDAVPRAEVYESSKGRHCR